MLATSTAPDLRLGPVSIWIQGWESPEDDGFWDGNWLVATVVGESDGGPIRMVDSCLRSEELQAWGKALAEVLAGRKALAATGFVESSVACEVRQAVDGAHDVGFELTPDDADRRVPITARVPSEELAAFVAALEGLEARYPIRGEA
jgi:hypothetical protein